MADLYPSTTSSPYPSLDTVQNHPKAESKPQATFLTKLYALLERPENQHMIRWDPQGEHIIVERPEQLALHVLPSIYRQSRFASFSRQLNIYGFMRKVNLRNVDPAIDDPDASTWSHPTLNRHSPPEVVANFKRRVPPRLPKPRKRDLNESQLIPPPRSAIPSGGPPSPTKLNGIPPSPLVGRARGFSAPGSFTPAWASAAGAQSNGFPRSSIPPLTVPGASDPPSHSYADDPASPTSSSYSSHYSHQNHYPSNPYPDVSSHQWFGSPTSSSSSNSLSSLLNPSTRPTPTINTSVNGSGSGGGYVSPYSSIPLHGHGHHHHHGGSDHSSSATSPLSPDAHSRPHTSYSMSQMGYGSEDSGYAPGPPTSAGGSSRPNSSHRPLSPSPRPPSSNRGSPYHTSSSMTHSHSASSSFRNGHGRVRRHSQAMSPYPLPYDHSHSGGLDHHTRPSTSPQPHHQTHTHHHGHTTHGTSMASLPRVRSMIQLPSVEPTGSSHAHYGSYASAHSHPSNGSDFAYSPVSGGGSAIPSIPSSSSISSLASVSSSAYSPLDYRHSGRPGTSTSSISQNSSSQANTPPLDPFPTSGTGEGKFSVSGENGHGTGYPDSDGMGVAVVNVRGYVGADDTFGFTVPGEYGGA